jgi:SAM-dependent methyltransferase
VSYPERIVPEETSPGIVALHLKRYDFALDWCRGRDVLDAGCGVGYGSAYLAEQAQSVVGVDRDPEAIAHARAAYPRPNLEFRVANLLELDLAPSSFDTVCSFEVIEHLDDHEAFLAGVVRSLRESGVLIVSTPHVEETRRDPDNPFHEVELSPADFQTLLRTRFSRVELYGQRRLQTSRHRLMQRLDVLGLRKRLPPLRQTTRVLGTPPMAEVTLDQIVIDTDVDAATELVAVCSQPLR